MDNNLILSINSDAFFEIRASFDRTLNAALKKMQVRDSDKAEIDLKVNIKLTDQKALDVMTGESMTVKNPEIKYQIKHKLEYKTADEEAGTIGQADSQLICKDGVWQIQPVDTGQMTIKDFIK